MKKIVILFLIWKIKLEDICKTFSLKNSYQEQNLIERLSKLIVEKLLKKRLERDLIRT